MWVISCTLNVALFSFICFGFHRNTRWVRGMFGPPSPARSALFAVYLAALVFSVILFAGVFPTFAVPLLLFHVATIIAVPFTYQNIRHPVVVTYLLLAVVHSITIVQLWDNNPL